MNIKYTPEYFEVVRLIGLNSRLKSKLNARLSTEQITWFISDVIERNKKTKRVPLVVSLQAQLAEVHPDLAEQTKQVKYVNLNEY